MRSPLALTWAGVLIGGVVPALLTGLADRRFGFTIIALPLLAVIELSWFINRMVAPRLPRIAPLLKTGFFGVSALYLCLFQTWVMFSRQGEKPLQLHLVETVRPLVTPGTVVVHLDTTNPCPFFYGVYDILRSSGGRIGYVHLSTLPDDMTSIFADHRVPADSWQYRDTELAFQAETVRTRRDWSRMLFVFYSHPNTLVWQQRLKERYPNGTVREIPIPPHIDIRAVSVFEAPWEP